MLRVGLNWRQSPLSFETGHGVLKCCFPRGKQRLEEQQEQALPCLARSSRQTVSLSLLILDTSSLGRHFDIAKESAILEHFVRISSLLECSVLEPQEI